MARFTAETIEWFITIGYEQLQELVDTEGDPLIDNGDFSTTFDNQ